MRKYLLIGACVTLFLLVVGVPTANGTVTIQAPGSTIEGKTIGEWTAEWWQWAFSQSVPNDAFTDATGANAAVGQTGPVFFVAGTTGGSATRSFTVPGDKFLLVPLINVSMIGLASDETALRAAAASFIGYVDSLFAEIDGITVPESTLFSHHELSPVFGYVAAPDNPFSLPPGPSGNEVAVSDGYWLMLNPLGAGLHTIRFGGAASVLEFMVDVTDRITAIPEPICRSAGFWGTHAGTECPKKQPNCGSQNITQDVITAAGGCLAVCGKEVNNTTLKDANSAVEAICVSPSGDIELQLARQLTAATLNCVMSGSTTIVPCDNATITACTTCGNLTIPGQDINIGTLVTACNDACIGSTATITLGGVEVNCIDALNCFNNGGVFNAGTGPSTATCQTGTCSIDNSPCGIEGLPSCPTVIVGGIAQSQTCVPLPDNCESKPLCQVATPGNLTPGTPGLLCFDAINADVECPQPPAPAPAICTPAPGPAGSSNECNAAIKSQCTIIEGGCTTGNGSTCPVVMTVTFNVTVPSSTDATGGSVYIAGSFNQWNRSFMTRVDATHWTITLTGLPETAIEYVYALEDWTHVERDGNCQPIVNHQLTLNYSGNSTQIVNDFVVNWRNVAPCGD